MDGVLRRTGDNAWKATLGGYELHVGRISGVWNCWIMATVNETTQCTRLVLTGESIADVAGKARKWIEENPRQ